MLHLRVLTNDPCGKKMSLYWDMFHEKKRDQAYHQHLRGQDNDLLLWGYEHRAVGEEESVDISTFLALALMISFGIVIIVYRECIPSFRVHNQ